MYDDGIFEDVGELWKEYLTLVSGDWLESDIRHSLGSEVRNRLRQIDLILRHLHEAIATIAPDPVENQKRIEWILASLGRVNRGEMAQEEFNQGAMRPAQELAALVDSWDDIWIFTETFYFYAWRVVEILNDRGPREFPSLDDVKAHAINVARNQLIQHPEHAKSGSQDLNQGLFLTSSGPVLRSLSAVLRLDSGRIEPQADAKDRGLFVAAEEMRDELKRRFSEAISKNRK
jgi:hypothetical protein